MSILKSLLLNGILALATSRAITTASVGGLRGEKVRLSLQITLDHDPYSKSHPAPLYYTHGEMWKYGLLNVLKRPKEADTVSSTNGGHKE